MTKTWVACTAAALFCVSSCSPGDGLGDPCLLVKKDPSDPTGNRSITIKEYEIKDLANTDIISFGAPECENLVCIRAANTPVSSSPTTTDASGFCSRACSENNLAGCNTGNAGIDSGDPYACRSMALDAEALALIQQQHPELIPPGVDSPFFCAKPLVLSTP